MVVVVCMLPYGYLKKERVTCVPRTTTLAAAVMGIEAVIRESCTGFAASSCRRKSVF